MDDEPSICEVLSLFLQEQDHEVECAGSGSEALECFPRQQWDLVITDRMMPGMSGDELAASIRGLDPAVPMMLVTGSRDRGETFPFDARLPKPFTRASFLEAMTGALKRREIPAEAGAAGA